jgi:hypothetical protein
MKQWIAIVAALLIETQAHAQSGPNSGRVYLPSCLAAADIVQGKRPTADSDDAAKQLKRAAICFGAVTAIMNLEPLLKPEFAMCHPADSKVSFVVATRIQQPLQSGVKLTKDKTSDWRTVFF